MYLYCIKIVWWTYAAFTSSTMKTLICRRILLDYVRTETEYMKYENAVDVVRTLSFAYIYKWLSKLKNEEKCCFPLGKEIYRAFVSLSLIALLLANSRGQVGLMHPLLNICFSYIQLCLYNWSRLFMINS